MGLINGDTQPLQVQHPPVVKRERTCPTCGVKTTFTYLGDQRWPPKVAKKMNMPEVVHLWQCGHCQTTITERD